MRREVESEPVVRARRGLAEGSSVVIGATVNGAARNPALVDEDAVVDLASAAVLATGLSGMIEASASRSLAVKLRPR